jgi:hypothetical protein
MKGCSVVTGSTKGEPATAGEKARWHRAHVRARVERVRGRSRRVGGRVSRAERGRPRHVGVGEQSTGGRQASCGRAQAVAAGSPRRWPTHAEG